MGTKSNGKKEIRAKMLSLRDSTEADVWKRKTQEIERRAVSHPWFLEAPAICCYVDFRGEAGTEGIIKEAWRLGKKVLAPRVEGGHMEFLRMDSFEQLEPGAFGALEPKKRLGEAERAFGAGSLMIMPGVAFDKERNRIGYGGGYYDRYLSAHTELRTMALAFEYQILYEVPHEGTDIRPEIIVTERRIL